MKQIARYTALVLAVALTVGSLTVLTVRQRLLTPALYTGALDKAGVYAVFTGILETKVAAYLTQVGKDVIQNLVQNRQPTNQKVALLEPAVLWFVNQTIEQQTPKIVQSVSQNIQLSKTFQNTTETGINGSIAWLKGEQADPQFFKYIPANTRKDIIYLCNSPLVSRIQQVERFAIYRDNFVFRIPQEFFVVIPCLPAGEQVCITPRNLLC